MIFYAIKHKPTGRYLPPGLGSGGRGFTHVEPEDGRVWHPRLFTAIGAARCALRWWLKGKTSVTHSRSTDWFGYEDDSEDWHTEPVPERIAEEMEIVKIKLKEIAP